MNIDRLIIELAGGAARPSLDNETWQYYGYKKRPKHGSWWNNFFPRMFELENFIIRKFLVMGLIDVLNAIKKSEGTANDKIVLSMGVIDHLLYATSVIFPKGLFMEDLFSAYDFHLKNPGLKKYKQIISEAKDILGKDNFQKFIGGTMKVLVFVNEEASSDFLLDSNRIKNRINNVIGEQPKKCISKVHMPDKMYKKYTSLVKEKILGI